MNTENKLIAEFMNWNIKSITTIPSNLHLTNIQLDNGDIMELKFNTSWDWIMHVVEKIQNFGFEFIIADTSIETTYKAVVQFIKEYNKQLNK